MTPSLAIKLIAAYALIYWATASFSHENQAGKHTGSSTVAAEQKDWGIAGQAKAVQKITLKHGEIKNLGMGAMTMVFQVKDPAFLDKVKAGDKVRFTADQVKGAFVVMSIERIEP